MIELVYLNENLTKKEADDLYVLGLEKRKRLNSTFLENLDSIDDFKTRERYISSCTPILGWI